ncbi:hypothetical protein ADILRU_1701 [Leifsonia rubra CMS 76R]|nr:hypothetical protein ADILRU_1701 [Leifsonia rubra CMS 76R]
MVGSVTLQLHPVVQSGPLRGWANDRVIAVWFSTPHVGALARGDRFVEVVSHGASLGMRGAVRHAGPAPRQTIMLVR